jgi:hypothetical protein
MRDTSVYIAQNRVFAPLRGFAASSCNAENPLRKGRQILAGAGKQLPA